MTITMPLLHDRNQTRRFFQQAWRKHLQYRPLEPLEKQLVTLISQHPEYHPLLENDDALEIDFAADIGSNPFLHLGLHLSLRDQIATDSPKGIQAIAHKLLARHHDTHEVEHKMMECLIHGLRSALPNNFEPNADHYLECLKKRLF